MVIMGALFVGLLGCAYPTVKPSPVKPDEVLDFAEKNYDRYVITYCGNRDRPTAIAFDLKGDDKTLTGEGWYPIDSKSQLVEMIRYMIARYRFYNGVYSGPYLFEMVADGKIFGYYYSIFDSPVIRHEGNRYSIGPISEIDIREARKGYSVKGAGG